VYEVSAWEILRHATSLSAELTLISNISSVVLLSVQMFAFVCDFAGRKLMQDKRVGLC
jgi:hypothetical protein